MRNNNMNNRFLRNKRKEKMKVAEYIERKKN